VAAIECDYLYVIVILTLDSQLELCVLTLQSTVLVARSIQELCELMMDLPDYASHFVNMICKILQEYLDSCQQAYHGIHTVSACTSLPVFSHSELSL